MIEVNETEPVEPSLTIVLRGAYVEEFKAFIEEAKRESFMADDIWGAINS